MRKLLKKTTALLMMLVMAVSLVSVFGSVQVNAAAKTYKMPTGLKTYEYKSGKWKKTNDRKYKYDKNGNMTNWDGTAMKLTYKKGKLKKVTSKSIPDGKEIMVPCNATKNYDSKGRVTKVIFNYDGETKYTYAYKYDKKGYIISRSRSTDGVEDGKELYKIKYHKNGIPKEITKTFSYKKNGKNNAFYADNVIYKTKYIQKFDKDGYCTSSKRYDGKKLVSSCKVTYKKSGGVVKSAVETYSVKDGKKSNYKWKYVYSYGKAKTKNKKAYVAIVGMTQNAFTFQTIGDNSAVGWLR